MKEIQEESRTEGSAIRQIGNYVELAGGLTACALGFILLGLWQVLKLLLGSNALQITLHQDGSHSEHS